MDTYDDRDAISEFIDTEHSVGSDLVPVSERQLAIAHSEEIGENVKADYDQTRRSMKAVIEAGTEAIDKLAKVCEESESPRAYEVLSTTLKTITEMNTALMELHKTTRDLTGQKSPENVTNNNTAVLFNGSTEELQKFLQNKN